LPCFAGVAKRHDRLIPSLRRSLHLLKEKVREAFCSLAAGLLCLALAGAAFAQQTPPSSPPSQTPQKKTNPSSTTGKAQQQSPPQPGKLQLQAPGVLPAPPKPQAPKAPGQKKQVLVEAVEFRGNRRYPYNTLMAHIFTHPGDVYNVNDIERDLMALWNTGYFDDIRVVYTNGKTGRIITFFVAEKKLVRSIDYKGMSSVSESDVMDRFQQEHVPLTIMSLYDPVVVKQASVVIQEMLSEVGRPDATVSPRTHAIPPDSVALTFVVIEGPKVKVGSIRFTGNTVFSTDRLIRVMKYTKPYGVPPIFYIFHRTYNRDKLDYDLEQVRELYQSKGYFLATHGDPIIQTVNTQRPFPFVFLGKGRGKRVDITIPIDQGEQFRLGRFTITGNTLFKTPLLKRILGLNTGDIFDYSKLRKALDNYTTLYGDYGYINFTAVPDVEPDLKKRVVNLALDFTEDKQFFIHRITFTGNTKTRDRVIRRQILLDEGSVFDTALWRMSVYRINQLGFFNPISDTKDKKDYTVVQNAENSTVDITVPLKEKGRNSIGFTGGVSGIEGDFVGGNYATHNFLGLGDTLSIGGSVGTFVTTAQLGFTMPYLFNRPITGGFTIFLNDYHFDELEQYGALYGVNLSALAKTPFGQTYFENYQQNSKGFTTFIQYPLKRSFARLGLTYGYTYSDLEAYSTASEALFEDLDYGAFAGPSQLHGIVQSTVTPTYEYYSIDNPNPFAAHRGKSLDASLAFSGSALGGNVDEIAPTVDFKYYHPINNKRNTLAFHFRFATLTGYDGKVPPPYARFYMGGQYDIRGFNIYSISPVIFFPTVGQVCNRTSQGNQIWAVNSKGVPEVGTCGSYTSFPYNTVEVPGGDTEFLSSFEYRIPIYGPVTLAYFIDVGDAFILYPSDLKLQPNALSSITSEFPYFSVPNGELKPVSSLNFRPRSSTGLALEMMIPVVHAPIEIYYGYNWLRLDNVYVTPPQELPPESLFPNSYTYNAALSYFERQAFSEPSGMAGFTVGGTF
jgi:outer membrane protein insertion porin family